MLGFAKLSNEVGIAFDAPSPEWNLKFLSMSAITAAAAAPAPRRSNPGARGCPATAPAKPADNCGRRRQSDDPGGSAETAGQWRHARGQQANGATRHAGRTRPERRQRAALAARKPAASSEWT